MTQAIDLFREHVLRDVALQERLRGLGSRDGFVARVVELAAGAGFDLTPDQVAAALSQARREWLERWIEAVACDAGHGGPAGMTAGPSQPESSGRCRSGLASEPFLAGWTPVRLRLDGEPSLEWVYTGARRFTDPFFDHTIEAALRDPFSLLFRHRTPVDALGEWSEATAGLRPSGFVFHMTRCGSTLVAQMLASSPRHLVLSEASPVDAALRSGRAELVRLVVSALGRPPAAERMLVLKLDSWSIFALDLVEDAFPGVPWIFLFRNPLEVLSSQLRNAGAPGVPGVLPPEFFGLEHSELATMPREEYLARVLARICEAALAHAGSPNGKFVEYTRLPAYVLDELPRHFGFELGKDERQRMSQVGKLDAKNPVLPFEPDSGAKLAAATPAAREASDRLLASLYERLRTC